MSEIKTQKELNYYRKLQSQLYCSR